MLYKQFHLNAGYGLNKHFTTNQDSKLLSFQGLPVETDRFNRSPYLLSDESMFLLAQSFPHVSRADG